MAQSTSAQRLAWKAYECETDKMLTIPFGPDQIRVAPPTADAWRALETVLQSHDYQIRPEDTDSYNCRQITGGTGRSLHSFGIALDVNWTTNPYRQTPDKRKVRFSDKPTQAERAIDVKQQRADTDMTPQMIDDVLAITTRTGKRVFEWGGNWNTVKDPMHFELDVTPADLEGGIDWTSVKKSPGEVVADDVAPANGSRPGAAAGGPAASAGMVLGSFNALQPLIEKWEGGFSNHPSDPGGATNMGITQETLARWRGRPVSVDEVRQLTRDEARQIFQARYWTPLRGDELPLPAAEMAYNTSVLSGPRRAVLVLQEALNRQGKSVALDGDIGPATIGASRTADQRRLVDDYADIYEAYLRGLPAFATFGQGWLNRLADIREAARSTTELISIAQTQPNQTAAIKDMETTMTSEEILRLILTAVNASRPAAGPSGDPGVPGRATLPAQPQAPPISSDVFGQILGSITGVPGRATLPAQPQAPPMSSDVFGQILGSIIGRIIPQLVTQAQLQTRTASAQAMDASVPDPAAQPLVSRGVSTEAVTQPAFAAAPPDMALGETIGSALAGRKTVLAMLAYAGALALKPYSPALGTTIDTIMPLIYALGGWGVVGKIDKWLGALTGKQAPVVATSPDQQSIGLATSS